VSLSTHPPEARIDLLKVLRSVKVTKVRSQDCSGRSLFLLFFSESFASFCSEEAVSPAPSVESWFGSRDVSWGEVGNHGRYIRPGRRVVGYGGP
jgi:hypothetical protein